MAKLSEQKKVELLEAAIVANDIETVKSLYAQYTGFEFTARALSMACRVGTPELVQFLCENGATFVYEPTSAFVKKYDCKIATSNRDSYPKNYNRYIARIEHFCVGVNQNIYDRGTVYALAHGYLDGQVLKRRMEPIIDKKQLGASEDYYENIHAVLSWMEKESQKRKKKQVRENAI